MIGFHFLDLFVLCLVPFLLFIGVAGTIFWILAIIDCATKEPEQGNDKLVWLLVIIFLHLLGAIIYYLVRRPERIRMYGH
jgi:hypothetical protein